MSNTPLQSVNELPIYILKNSIKGVFTLLFFIALFSNSLYWSLIFFILSVLASLFLHGANMINVFVGIFGLFICLVLLPTQAIHIGHLLIAIVYEIVLLGIMSATQYW